MKPVVLIFEPKIHGHHLGFARQVAEALVAGGAEVILAVCHGVLDQPEGMAKLKRLPSGIELHACIEPVTRRKLFGYQGRESKFDRLRRTEPQQLLRLLTQGSFDHVVVPTADSLLPGLLTNIRAAFALSRLRSADLILHQIYHTYPPGRLRKRKTNAYWKTVYDWAPGCRLLTPDPFSAYSGYRCSWFGRTLTHIPHPLTEIPECSAAEARRRLNLSEDDTIIGAIGDLHGWRRKAIPLLLDAVNRLSGGRPICLALYGRSKKSHSEVAAHLRSARLHTRFEFLDDDEFGLFFRAVDVVWAIYDHHVGVPSVLLYSALANVPSVTSDWGASGWIARRTQTAFFADLNVDSAVRTLELALEVNRGCSPGNSKEWKHLIDAEKFHRILCEPLDDPSVTGS